MLILQMSKDVKAYILKNMIFKGVAYITSLKLIQYC